jgi:1,6-anhydro-N-acetylmuramate kinase
MTAAQERAPLARLNAARAKRERLVIGLLSGTSADGTDAALCAIEGVDDTTRLTTHAFVSTPFSRPLRERIFRLAEASAAELCDVDVLLGESFAEAAREVAAVAGVPSTTRARPAGSAPRCRLARRRSSPSGPAARW